MKLEGYSFSFDEDLEVPYSREEIVRLYWKMHPRFRFVKSCKNGNFLDIGSGSGGLFFWEGMGTSDSQKTSYVCG